ncbi:MULTISPECIES: hypothetical protein [Sphingobium]|nr:MULTISPECIES: hypothetical protein [Sphingobium]WDA34904.1 hypothetical protein PO876_15680 [Sphingobium sp. YC-XJ3]
MKWLSTWAGTAAYAVGLAIFASTMQLALLFQLLAHFSLRLIA